MKKILFLIIIVLPGFSFVNCDFGNDEGQFLSVFRTAINNVAIKAFSAADEDPDPLDTQYIIIQDIGGKCIYTHNNDETGAYSITYSFNNYNADGSVFNGTLIMTVDASFNGSFTGTITATGTYSGTIEYCIIITDGFQSGYFTVNGQDFDLSGNPI